MLRQHKLIQIEIKNLVLTSLDRENACAGYQLMLLALRQYKVCLISSLPLVTRFLSTGSDEEGASMSMFDLNDVMGMNTLDELLKLYICVYYDPHSVL